MLYGTGLHKNKGTKIHHDDCFLLDLERAKGSAEPASMWTRVRSHMAQRYHTAVLEPISRSLRAIGGSSDMHPEAVLKKSRVSDVVKMSVRLLPLRMLAMQCCRRYINPNDPRLPPLLKNELEAYREKKGDGYWLCRESGCDQCKLNVGNVEMIQ